jgi:hypothetical protein
MLRFILILLVILPFDFASGQNYQITTGENEVCQNEVTIYQIEEIAGADACEWMLTPSQAGVFLGGEISCSVTWSNTFTGIATLKVRGVNNCGEGGWSPALEVFVDDCTGISLDSKADEFRVYPNPSNGSFVITGNFINNQPVVISITDLIGAEFFRQIFTTEIIQIELEELNSGVYFLKIEDHFQPIIKKIIVNR